APSHCSRHLPCRVVLLSFYPPFLFHCSGDHRHLPSFPTRRSSDLAAGLGAGSTATQDPGDERARRFPGRLRRGFRPGNRRARSRSEEHTSELQSLTNLVCRLLLEKKKNKTSRIARSQFTTVTAIYTVDTVLSSVAAVLESVECDTSSNT